MKLTTREKTALFMEGIITVILLLLLNLAVVVIINQAIQTNPGLRDGIFIIKRSIVVGPNDVQLWSWQNVFIFAMFLIDVWVVYWRLIRRYHQMQLRHVISELHYIAEGHFDHRIPFNLSSDMQRVVDSVNSLVDSVIQSVAEERQIEQSKDELITNVSHDLRTPLTSIIGYLGLIEDKQYQTTEDMLKYTHTAFMKANQMKALVEDLFEYTTVRAASNKLQIHPLNLGQMMEQIAASYELEADKKQLTIEAEVDDPKLMIDADAEKLSRVFSNLITNAFKYGNGAKRITLAAKKLNENEVEIRVSNDGRKIPEASLNQLFERFYRVEESRSKETGGTGLGLAITQSIVQLHGGDIHAESTDALTSFVIHLPVHQPEVTTVNE